MLLKLGVNFIVFIKLFLKYNSIFLQDRMNRVHGFNTLESSSIFVLCFTLVPHMIPGKVYGCSKLQKIALKVFYFCKIFKAQANIMKSVKFFIFVLYCTKRTCSQIEPQLLKKKMGAKHPRSLVYINIKIILVIIFSPYFILLIPKKVVIFTSDRVIHSFNVLLSAWREVANSFSTEFFSSTCLLKSGVHSGKLIISAPIDHNHK